MENFLKSLSPKEQASFLVNLNRYQLNRKEHIKKYNKLRKMHGEILDSMIEYVNKGKYSPNAQFQLIKKDVARETNNIELMLDEDNEDDFSIVTDLFIYKNHKKIQSLTDVYLEKKIFRNKEKVAMLNSMKNSYVGLFKIVDTDRKDGYVYLQDVFTYKKFKIIDISLSSTGVIDPKRPIYMYNRIITIDDISFATGIHCILDWKNNLLKEFIKKHKYNRCSDFSRCILLYEISKYNNKLETTYNHQYGYR